MRTILVSYDLLSPETRVDYQRLHEKIKSYSMWAKPLESVWLVKTSSTAAEVRDFLKQALDSNDRLLALDVTNTSWATYNVSSNVNEWIKSNL